MNPSSERRLRCAVVGAGIAGMACADRLSQEADVVMYESSPRLGGHTDTHDLMLDGQPVAIDSGFIVFNRTNYPRFDAWLDRLGVRSHASDMSFSVTHHPSGEEYGTHNLAALFCQPANLFRLGHWRMLRDILRFHRLAETLLESESRMSLVVWCRRQGLSQELLDRHLLPMCAALWSQSLAAAGEIAIGQVISFMRNHHMLQVNGRPEWRVITGGSREYVRAFVRSFNGSIRRGEPVRAVRERAGGAELLVGLAWQRFDAVVLACLSDQALALIQEPTLVEANILGNIRYATNRVVVHTDPTVMPRSTQAWSSWNALTGIDPAAPCAVTYWMNRLQQVRTTQPVFVTLNPQHSSGFAINPSTILAERTYAHPQFDSAALAAQSRLTELNGHGHRYFAGAWQGYGFHEDGYVSGVRAAECLLSREHRIQSLRTAAATANEYSKQELPA